MSQDVDLWVRELRAAGWTAVAYKRGSPRVGTPVNVVTNIWRSPEGLLYRGPYKAWKVMKDPDYERSNDG